MTADVDDLDEIKTGAAEGIFGAIYWWMVKVGYAIAGALSGVIITVVGFNPDLATVDQQGAVDGLLAFFCFFPMAGTLLAMLIMRSYNITEERANEISSPIGEKQGGKRVKNEENILDRGAVELFLARRHKNKISLGRRIRWQQPRYQRVEFC